MEKHNEVHIAIVDIQTIKNIVFDGKLLNQDLVRTELNLLG